MKLAIGLCDCHRLAMLMATLYVPGTVMAELIFAKDLQGDARILFLPGKKKNGALVK